MNFALKDKIQAVFNVKREEVSKTRFLISNMASGGIGGAISITFTYPIDLMRTRLAMDLGSEKKREIGSLS